MPEKRAFDVIIVGGGIAGAGLAYFLAARGRHDVLVLEREAQPGYHASGRSAATLVVYHRHPVIRALIARGGEFLRDPPPGFADAPLLERFGVIVPAGGPAWDELQALGATMAAEGIHVEPLDLAACRARHPALSPDHFDGGLYFPDDGGLDLHGLLHGYLRRATHAGGLVRLSTEVTAVTRAGGRVTGVATAAGEFRAPVVVDAAGAWAGEVARLAGAAPIPMQPLRRTIITFAAPAGLEVRGLPMIDCESRSFYCKPESGGFLVSPMDETPMAPCDAAPAEEDVADAIDKVAAALPPLAPGALRRKWAGLRTFAPDRVPVVGFDPGLPGFFWLAGQGGVGLETSPILGRVAADLIVDGRTDAFDAARLAPDRFRA
jgi:D-arginine dehydrogenase